MTVYNLAIKCLWMILKGRGKSPIFFDTEGRTFDYHLAHIASAYCEEADSDYSYFLVLHED